MCVLCGKQGFGSRFAPVGRKGHCVECWVKRKADKEAAKHKTCKRCGKPFYTNDKRQVICKLRCGGAHELIACEVCGKECKKEKFREHKTVACSRKCQIVLLQRGASRRAEVLKSKARKQQWKKQQSKRRKNENIWLSVVTKELAKIKAKSSYLFRTLWETKCHTAIGGLRTRCTPIIKTTKEEKCNKWGCLLKREVQILRATTNRARLTQWDRKMRNAVSSLAKRKRNRCKRQLHLN
jgi:hypothetical protein